MLCAVGTFGGAEAAARASDTRMLKLCGKKLCLEQGLLNFPSDHLAAQRKTERNPKKQPTKQQQQQQKKKKKKKQKKANRYWTKEDLAKLSRLRVLDQERAVKLFEGRTWCGQTPLF